MGTFSGIELALSSRLSLLPGIPAVQWPNVKYSPNENTEFFRPTLLPGDTKLETISGQSIHTGIYQIDIFVPLEKGIFKIDSYMDSIEDHFKAIRTLTSGNITVFIQAIGRGLSQRQDSWYVGFVEINYICHA
jgi:hypothetical protein